MHTGVKPFKCTTCGKSCVHSCVLRAHDIVHTGIRAFTCETCGKSYVRSIALNTHKRMHTGVKPFKCTCGKSFVHSYVLRAHDIVHTGIKAFSCETCGKSYVRSSAPKHTQTYAHRCETFQMYNMWKVICTLICTEST